MSGYTAPLVGSTGWGTSLNQALADVFKSAVQVGLVANVPASPIDGQLYIATDNGCLYRYSTSLSAWKIAACLWGGHGRWVANGSQSSANGNVTVQYATARLTPSSAIISFASSTTATLNLEGVYDIQCGVRTAATGTVNLSLWQSNNAFAEDYVIAASSGTNRASTGLSDYFAAGAVVRVNLAATNVGAINTSPTADSTFLSITYRGMTV